MFSLKKDFINFQDKLLEVIRSFPEHRIKDVGGMKELLSADIALKNNGKIYFCTYVTEAEIIEEQENQTNK